MATILISFLGKGNRVDGGYRTTTYDIGGTHYTTAYFGLALAKAVGADTLRVLGTPGSMWDALALELAPEMGDWETLYNAVEEDRVGSEELSLMQGELAGHADYRIQAGLIPYGVTEAEQVAILREIAHDLQPGDRIILDVTHGLRHLPMLGLLSAFYLQAVADVQVTDLYYGAFERKVDGITPVVRLNGLLRLYDWVRALEQFKKDGDYGLFSALLAHDGLPQANLLAEAAYMERISNPAGASQKLGTFEKAVGNTSSPLAELFLPELKKRIAWHRRPTRAEKEKQLADEYLGRGDYLRAAIFAYESLVTQETCAAKEDANDFEARKSADERLKNVKETDFRELKNLRNALAHGLRSRNGRAKDLVKTEEGLRAWLMDTFRKLLR